MGMVQRVHRRSKRRFIGCYLYNLVHNVEGKFIKEFL